MLDYDGVIVDSKNAFTATFLAACRICGYTGIKTPEQVVRLFDGNFFEALIHLGLSSEKIDEIYYVGDTKGDMIEGKQAGAVTVAVTWGWHTAENLAQASPDHLVNTLSALENLLS